MKPIIPMRPEDLPQQRVTPVVTLPARPPQFHVRCHWERELSDQHRPKKMPKTARFVATLEWAWAPMSDRLSEYYISTNQARAHWLLWSRSYDDNECRWRDTLYAYGPKKRVLEKTAAVYLVFEDLRRGSEVSNLDRFHWIGADHGLLSTPELLAIARAVWP